jgi:copper chaperone CopZ
MASHILTVTGMSCMGCVNSVKKLVSAVPGVSGVEVDLASGQVQVQGRADLEAVKQTILDGGYGIAE